MYKDLEQALLDLEKAGMLKRVYQEVDPFLEMAEIARQTDRIFLRDGALFVQLKSPSLKAELPGAQLSCSAFP